MHFFGKLRVQHENQRSKHRKTFGQQKRQVPETDQFLTISCKENVVLEAHKGFPPRCVSCHSLAKYCLRLKTRVLNSNTSIQGFKKQSHMNGRCSKQIQTHRQQPCFEFLLTAGLFPLGFEHRVF